MTEVTGQTELLHFGAKSTVFRSRVLYWKFDRINVLQAGLRRFKQISSLTSL